MLDTAGFHNHIYSNTSHIPAAKKQASPKLRLVKIFIGILVILLVGETLYHLFAVPAVSPVKIRLTTTGTLTVDEVRKAAGLTGKERWLGLDAAALTKRLSGFPPVAEVTVQKQFPDKVMITITERTAVAVLLASLDDRSVPMEIDKSGMVFRIAGGQSAKGLPVISGLELGQPRAGMKVHRQIVPLFRQLGILQKKNPVLLSEISEIRIEQKKYGGFDLIIYPVQTKLKVRSGSSLNEEQLQYMMLVLDVFRDIGIVSMIDELDIRGKTASYHLKGVPNE